MVRLYRNRLSLLALVASAAALAACGSVSHTGDPSATSGPASPASAAPSTTTDRHAHLKPGAHRAVGRTADGWHITLIDTDTYQLTRKPDGTRSSSAEMSAGAAFRRETLATAARYATTELATAAGYRQVIGDGYHWVNPSYLDDTHHADPAFPESLVFYDLGDGRQTLIGAMFLEPETSRGREIAGPVAPWHYHEYRTAKCVVASGFPVAEVDAAGSCAQGVRATRSPEMLHVWFVNPDGPFSAGIYIPQLDEYRRATA